MIRKPVMAAVGLCSLLADRLIPQPEHLAKEELNRLFQEQAGMWLDDMEWRYKQARDLYTDRESAQVIPLNRQVTVEDMNTLDHRLTGYVLNNGTNGTPAGTSTASTISWSALHVVHGGIDYTIADGTNLATKYHYFVKANATGVTGTTGSNTLVSSNTKPTLGKDDVLVFINNNGTGFVAAGTSSASLPGVVATNAIDADALANDAVDAGAILNGAVSAGDLATGAINNANLFASGVVDATAIGTGAVNSDELASGAVISGKLSTTSAPITSASNFTAGVVNSTVLGSAAVTPIKLNTLTHELY